MGIRLAALKLALLFLATATSAQQAAAACSDQTVWLRGDFGKARFSVDVVDTPESRAQGLMWVEQMPRAKGMLFAYDSPQHMSFWMKNTLIPLDILFFDETGALVGIQRDAVPGDLTSLPSGSPAQFALEINGGLAQQMDISLGTVMQHPRVPDPQWACD